MHSDTATNTAEATNGGEPNFYRLGAPVLGLDGCADLAARYSGGNLGLSLEVDYRAGVNIEFFTGTGEGIEPVFSATLNADGAALLAEACRDYLAFWERIEQQAEVAAKT